jgi:hypothetical protein
MKAIFKGCWKGAHQKWILVDMHDRPPWVNKLLFPPTIKNKRSEPPMTNRLAALTKRVVELRQAGLEACHCVEKFYLRQIRPSVAGRNWRSNVYDWPIPIVNLRKVIPLTFLRIVDNNPI